MRIQNIEQPTQQSVERSAPQVAPETDNIRLFERTVTKLTDDAYMKSVKEAMDEITKQGEKIKNKADIVEFRKYREMIRGLLNKTVSDGFEFSKGMRFDGRGRARTFALIKKVNTKLDTMMQDLLHSESDQIKLIDDLDDIRGLLVDIFL